MPQCHKILYKTVIFADMLCLVRAVPALFAQHDPQKHTNFYLIYRLLTCLLIFVLQVVLLGWNIVAQ